MFSPSFQSLGVFGVLGRGKVGGEGKVGKGWLVLKLDVFLSGCLLKNSNTSTFWKGSYIWMFRSVKLKKIEDGST